MSGRRSRLAWFLAALALLVVVAALVPATTPAIEGPNAIAALEEIELGGVPRVRGAVGPQDHTRGAPIDQLQVQPMDIRRHSAG